MTAFAPEPLVVDTGAVERDLVRLLASHGLLGFDFFDAHVRLNERDGEIVGLTVQASVFNPPTARTGVAS